MDSLSLGSSSILARHKGVVVSMIASEVVAVIEGIVLPRRLVLVWSVTSVTIAVITEIFISHVIIYPSLIHSHIHRIVDGMASSEPSCLNIVPISLEFFDFILELCHLFALLRILHLYLIKFLLQSRGVLLVVL